MIISVIVPTLNESDWLEGCVQRIQQSSTGRQFEIIIIDAGSKDGTSQIAKQLAACQLHVHPDFKGKKYASLNRGAQLAKGEVFLFLDVDTTLPMGFDGLVLNAISQGAVGGAFDLRFDSENFLLKMIRVLNRIRYLLTQSYYGDQAIFCTRQAFEITGGYPERAVMEAAHFCDRLKKLGKLTLITTPVITSSRRFQEGGVLKVFLKDLRIYLYDLFGFSTRELGHRYWNDPTKK